MREARTTTTTHKSATTTSMSSIKRRTQITAYGFLSLQLIGLFVFVGGPLVVSFYYTFTHWDMIKPAPEFVGFNNWLYILQDPRIAHVLGNTIRFILLGTSSFLILSLFLALALNNSRTGTKLFRAIFFLPWVLSPVAVGVAWTWLLNTRSGPIAEAFRLVGARSPEFLLDPNYAMLAIAMVTTWQGIGFGMTLYLSGLQSIPETLYDAAKVDGASGVQQFRFITLPLLSPTLLFLTITSFIGAFQLYDMVVIMTGGVTFTPPGGPNDSTRTIVLYLYNQMFEYRERISGLGYAATIGWLLAIVIFIITAIQWVFSRRWVFYMGSEDR